MLEDVEIEEESWAWQGSQQDYKGTRSLMWTGKGGGEEQVEGIADRRTHTVERSTVNIMTEQKHQSTTFLLS